MSSAAYSCIQNNNNHFNENVQICCNHSYDQQSIIPCHSRTRLVVFVIFVRNDKVADGNADTYTNNEHKRHRGYDTAARVRHRVLVDLSSAWDLMSSPATPLAVAMGVGGGGGQGGGGEEWDFIQFVFRPLASFH